MNQRILSDLSQAIFKTMPPRLTYEQKAAVDAAAREVFARHFDRCNAEANALDLVIDRLHTQLDATARDLVDARAEIARLTALLCASEAERVKLAAEVEHRVSLPY